MNEAELILEPGASRRGEEDDNIGSAYEHGDRHNKRALLPR